MSREIKGITFFFGFLFLGMLAYISIFVTRDKEKFINNSYNPRQALFAEKNTRGTIYARDGQVLAETITSKNHKETRKYPFENVFSHVVGYATNGKLGIEAQENYALISSDISVPEKVENDKNGRKNPGNDVITTLDPKLQEAAYDALGSYKGAIIAMNPETGEILAMVSKPDFDPNKIPDIWDSILQDETSTVLLNRATQGVYPPGSTFKIVTALEYIREHPEDYGQYSYSCKGKFTYEDNTIRCYHGSVHGKVDLTESFAKSCNCSFANMGMQLNKTSFQETLKKLYLNQDISLEFPAKQSKSGIMPDTTSADMMQMSIGQGETQVTPLFIAMLTAAIANNGEMMKPYLVQQVTNAEHEVMKQTEPVSMGNVMSEKEAFLLKTLMEKVVESGTATKLSGLSYSAGGKTGSAEYNGVKEDSHAWFTGFAPVEKPKVVVTVILEGAGSGGDYAVPIARRVFDAYLK